MRGTQKRDKKNHAIVRVQKPNPGQIKYVRTLAVFFFNFFRPPLVNARFAEKTERSIRQLIAAAEIEDWLRSTALRRSLQATGDC
jgi:hypothetical protein